MGVSEVLFCHPASAFPFWGYFPMLWGNHLFPTLSLLCFRKSWAYPRLPGWLKLTTQVTEIAVAKDPTPHQSQWEAVWLQWIFGKEALPFRCEVELVWGPELLQSLSILRIEAVWESRQPMKEKRVRLEHRVTQVLVTLFKPLLQARPEASPPPGIFRHGEVINFLFA